MRKKMKRALLAFAVAALSTAAFGQTTVGSLTVDTLGDHGSPVILIPGLASGAWVWQDTVADLKRDHILYVVTLAGFDGRPAVTGKDSDRLIDLASDSLRDLIVSKKIVKPVLVGHSLGGTLSLLFAQKHSDLIAGVVALDGLLVFPGTEGMPAAQRPVMAAGMKKQMGGVSPEVFADQQLQYMKMAVIDPVKAAELAKLTARSDIAATAEYMAEDVTLDARAGMASIKVPVLVIAPFYAPDTEKAGITAEAKTEYYRGLLKGPSVLDVKVIAPARHFAMVDQPKAFIELVRGFLSQYGK
jgi:pimeloyl-ACP methyl ester carboxylesterase